MSTKRTTLTPERYALYMQIQTCCAGNRTDDAIAALIDSFAMVLGYAADTPEDAVKLFLGCRPDIEKTVRNNWDVIAEAKSQIKGGGHA